MDEKRERVQSQTISEIKSSGNAEESELEKNCMEREE